MKTKILTLALCLTGILAQNIQAQTTSEPISEEEITEFGTAFKARCIDSRDLTSFVEDSVLNMAWSQELLELTEYFSFSDSVTFPKNRTVPN